MISKIFVKGFIGAIILFLALIIGPLLIPVPPLQGTFPPEELADENSQFIKINNLDLHVQTLGDDSPAFLMMHGFLANLYSWEQVMEPLANDGLVIAYDRPAFGLTGRPLEWEGTNPYSPQGQLEIMTDLLDQFKVDRVILVGHSAGGSLAMQFALAYPDRVEGLILVAPAVYTTGGAPKWIRPILGTPQMRRLGPLAVRQLEKSAQVMIDRAWYDPSNLDPEILNNYRKTILVENWDKALWEFTIAQKESSLAGRLQEINVPVLVITGDSDQVIPPEESIRLSEELPNAALRIIPNAGHVPQEEHPDEFMDIVLDFLDSPLLSGE